MQDPPDPRPVAPLIIPSMAPSIPLSGGPLRRISLPWLLVFAVVWWILALPRTDAWMAGALAVALGGLLHTGLGGRTGTRLRGGGLLGFIPFFLGQSLQGGADVARRAFSPSLPLETGFLRYSVRLPEGPPRVLFVNCISLLPGTFSAEFDGRSIEIHLLARDHGLRNRLERLEEKVARLFGVPLGGGQLGGVPPGSPAAEDPEGEGGR
jgi:multicomponent Na+:H+ antiporter subunit E